MNYKLDLYQSTVDSIHGCLAGGAIGDSFGLPYEGLTKKRAVKLLGYPFPNKLLFGYGMLSDDTEHACMTAISLIQSSGHPRLFEKALINQLRSWFLCLPPATGFATAKACFKSLIGIPSTRIAANSAGNGTAMRAAVIGCTIKNTDQIKRLIKISSRLTHADQRSEQGALLIALGARWSCTNANKDFNGFFDFLGTSIELPCDSAFAEGILSLQDSLLKKENTQFFAQSIGSSHGVSGFIVPTTLVALHAWLANLNHFENTIIESILCGGDTDTVAAIAGSLAGAYVGFHNIPDKFGKKIIDYPFSYNRLSLLANSLSYIPSKKSIRPWLGKSWFLLPLRNFAFAFIVLLHVLRRMMPPY